VTLGSGSSTVVDVDNNLRVLAKHTANFTAGTNSVTAALVGASGSKTVNSANSNVNVTFGPGVVINAGAVDVDANNIINKGSNGGYDVTAGSGGLAGGPAASSSTVISDRTGITVADGASITVDGSGNMSMASSNQVNATDKVKLDSGGAIALAKAKSTIINHTNTNTIYIGDALLKNTVGDIELSTRSGANVLSQVNAKTYGVAGAAQGESYASVHADNRLILGDGADIQATGSIHLRAGVGNSFNVKARTDLWNKTALPIFNVKARTDLWNKTALPIKTDPDAHGEAVQSNLIDIRDGASVKADASVYIDAQKGYTYALGKGIGKDLYREVLAAIANFFGSIFGAKPVTFDIETSSSRTDNQHDGPGWSNTDDHY